MSELSFADALNVLRTGGKFWRAWAKLEEAAGVIEAEIAEQAQRQRRLVELGEQIERKVAQLVETENAVADAQGRVVAAQEQAERLRTEMGAQAEALLVEQERAVQAAKDREAAAVAAAEEAERRREAALAEEKLVLERIESAKAAARAALG